MRAVIAGLVRHVLTLVGGAGVATSENDLQQIVSALMVLGGFVWSVIEKRRNDKRRTKETITIETQEPSQPAR